ncbi:MAG: DUF192 domain-containing protein [Gaiellales bacterium]
MRPRLALSVLVLLSAAACGGGGEVEGARVVIETQAGEQEVAVEVADTDPERQRGLMQRTSLAADAGMVFVFPSETAGGFWMKNTLIPLSIAFYDAERRIVRILDMEPCRRDPCPVYDPGVAYVGALEVNLGAFRRWNVSEGDRLRLELD